MKAKIFLIIAAVVVAAAQPAAAALITIDIEAVVDSVDDPDGWLEGKINPGDIITGSYTYESTTADTNPSIYVGDYEHFSPPAGIWLSVGGFDFETDPANVDFLVSVADAGGPYTSDNYLVRSYNNLPFGTGIPVTHISWQLDDPTGNALSNTGLPATPADLGTWDSNRLRLEGDRAYIVQGHVTSAVPEPGTIILLAVAAVGLIRNHRRESQSINNRH